MLRQAKKAGRRHQGVRERLWVKRRLVARVKPRRKAWKAMWERERGPVGSRVGSKGMGREEEERRLGG